MVASGRSDALSFTRSAVGALAQLLAVGWVVSVALTLTSGSALANLPAAVLGVYALRVLAQVRLDARWDATTRRLSLSVTRVAPGDPADPSAGSFVAPANGAREGSAAKRAPVPGAASPHPSRDVPSSSPAPPPLHPADREAELRDLLRRHDPPPRDADPSAHGVLGAWSRLRDHIVRDFVLHLWYRSLTRDESFPNDVARLLDAAFVELAHRARRADLHRLFLRVVPAFLATQLEHFRDARDACGGVDAYVRLTPTAADRAIATQLRKRGRLHPGVEYANTDMGPDASVADVVALGAARDPAAARPLPRVRGCRRRAVTRRRDDVVRGGRDRDVDDGDRHRKRRGGFADAGGIGDVRAATAVGVRVADLDPPGTRRALRRRGRHRRRRG